VSSESSARLRVAVVGACASGKSTLVTALKAAGYEARHVAQEHSFVPEMWQLISRPDVLVYLDVAYETIQSRRSLAQFGLADLAEQNRRLEHAREHCDLYVNTNTLNQYQVQDRCLSFLDKVQHSD
jgi:deoxyadenosine/deoxycytidine kinase